MEETITIEKTYTKNEAFIRLNQITPTASEKDNPESEYNKLIDFC
jgi:hypothetical protein